MVMFSKIRPALWAGTFLGVILLFQQAWVPGFFQDGYLYAAFGKNALEKGTWLLPHLSDSLYARFYPHQPFPFALEGIFFAIFGSSFTAARIFGALFTFITGLFVYRWISKRGYAYWGLASMLLFYLIPSLMKKSRFPSTDAPIMLFNFLSLYFYSKTFDKEKNVKAWLGCGVFFGLALLTKGPIALFVPLAIGLHSLWNKRWGILNDKGLWVGWLVGWSVFAIWPLSLYFTGKFEFYQQYIHSTFVHTIKEGRGSGTPVWTYFVFLLKQAPLWIGLLFFFSYKIFKEKISDPSLLRIYQINLFYLVGGLAVLSSQSFKYSHYLIPLYPSLAILAGAACFYMRESWKEKSEKILVGMTITLGLVLLIFPLTVEIRRDREIFNVLEFFKEKELPGRWGIVDHAYPYYSLANMSGFMGTGHVFKVPSGELKSGAVFNKYAVGEFEKKLDLKNPDWIFLLKKETYHSLKPISGYQSIYYFKKKNLVVLVPKKYLEVPL